MTGLADEVREVLDDAASRVGRQLSTRGGSGARAGALVSALRAAHDAVVAMCAEDERVAAAMTELLNDQQESLDDEWGGEVDRVEERNRCDDDWGKT